MRIFSLQLAGFIEIFLPESVTSLSVVFFSKRYSSKRINCSVLFKSIFRNVAIGNGVSFGSELTLNYPDAVSALAPMKGFGQLVVPRSTPLRASSFAASNGSFTLVACGCQFLPEFLLSYQFLRLMAICLLKLLLFFLAKTVFPLQKTLTKILTSYTILLPSKLQHGLRLFYLFCFGLRLNLDLPVL